MADDIAGEETMNVERGADPAPWDDVLTEQDRRVIENGGYGKQRGLSGKKALVVIDCQRVYIGRDAPVDEQQDQWPAGGGEVAWSAVARIRSLLESARSNGVPVIYTRNVQKQTLAFDGFTKKSGWNHAMTMEGSDAVDIVPEIEPQAGDLVLDKSYASALHGTPLLSWLITLGVRSLIVTGVSTSGCVRATTVDAISYGFDVGVVEDAVADRISVSHKAALLDLWMKYADLLSAEQARAILSGGSV